MLGEENRKDNNIKLPTDSSSQDPVKNIVEQKSRIAKVWNEWKETQKIPELMSLVDRQTPYAFQDSPRELLNKYNYPDRTKISELKFDKWKVNLDSKFIKDGSMYLLRGDYPNLEKKGFYSRPYGYAKKTAHQLTEELHSSEETGYFLYGNEAYLKTAKPSYENIADELAYKQSAVGGSSFISTTTNLPCAIAGTGNIPDKEEQKTYQIYVVKIPIEYVINSNTGNHFGMNEEEYLVPDCIYPDEVVATFPRDQADTVYEYLHKELGVTQEDVGLSIE